MKKILVVDDNKNNRMILNMLIEDYMEESGAGDFTVKEASDGLQAVKLCEDETFDLVFMDIMMPVLDGIEATRRLREAHKSMMIIAVSAVDDSERQKKILNNGAEDYISKPVNADIFTSRLGNYLSLIDARQHRHFNDKSVNPYTKEVFSRQLIFLVSNEETLSEFWEYYLLGDSNKYAGLSDVVRTIFAIGDMMLKQGSAPQIVVEESEEAIFFTVTQIRKVNPKLIQLVLLKNQAVEAYMLNDEILCFRLEKIIDATEPVAPVVQVNSAAVQTAKPLASVAVETVEPSIPKVVIEKTSVKDYRVYNYMDPEDLEEVEDHNSRLSSLLLMVGSSQIEHDEVVEIATMLDRIGSVLNTYTESYTIAGALRGLSSDIETHVEMFRQNASALGPMCGAFSRDLSKWIAMTFYEGAPSVDFLNDTIVANSQTIGAMLKMNDELSEGADDGMDDIFDF